MQALRGGLHGRYNIATVVALLAAIPAAAQAPPAPPLLAPARYRFTADTLYYQGLNSYHMYAVRGADTLGRPVNALSVERHRWRDRPAALEVEIDKLDLDTRRAHTTDTFALRADGRVLTINGKADTGNPRGRYDAFPRLAPSGAGLDVGTTWADTFSTRGRVPAGAFVFTIERRWRAVRALDTLGAGGGRGALELAATGTVHYRDAYWTDSAAGRAWWIDVRGPITETAWFDPTHGRLLGRSWTMDLSGRAGLPDSAGRVDTLPAGLKSTDTYVLIEPARAAILARPLQGPDTLVTSRGGTTVVLHTGGQQADTVVASQARNDGLLGTARLELDGRSRPRRYEAVWTDSTPEIGRQVVERHGDTLVVSGQFTRRYPVPPTDWTIADHGLPELLVPVLLSLPADAQGRPIRILRPYLNLWEEGQVALRAVGNGGGDGYVGLVQMATDSVPTVYLIGPQGDLLLVFRRDLRDVETAPPATSTRYARLTRLIRQLQP